jgi:hypothetical protein
MSVAEKIVVKISTRNNWKTNGPGRSYNAFEYDAVITMGNVDPYFVEKLVAWMESMGGDVEREGDARALPQHFPAAFPTASEPATTPRLPEQTDDKIAREVQTILDEDDYDPRG